MTGPAWILAGAAIFALIYAIGLRARTTVAQAQLRQPPYPLKSDVIYDWAHEGPRPCTSYQTHAWDGTDDPRCLDCGLPQP